VDPRSLFELGDSPVPQTPRSRGVDPRSLLEPGLRSPDLAPGSPSCEVYNGRVRASRPRLFVALDAASVSGGAVARSGDGYRFASHARMALPAGALAPSPFAANLARPAEVADALRELARELSVGAAPACLLLPDGVARLALVDVPADVTAQQYARFRIVPGPPYPAGEAVIDVMPLGPGRAVVAAVRRSIVEEYETAAMRAGITQDRLDLTPLAAIAGLLREPGPRGGLTVDVVLGDAALCLAAHEAGTLRVLRNRRRDPGPDEARRLAEEVERTAVLAGDGAGTRIRVVGPGARGLLTSWRSRGGSAEPGWRSAGPANGVDAAELPWLGGAAG